MSHYHVKHRNGGWGYRIDSKEEGAKVEGKRAQPWKWSTFLCFGDMDERCLFKNRKEANSLTKSERG